MSYSSLVLKCASFAACAAAALLAAFPGGTPTTAPGWFRFTDVTERSGIHFRHNAGKAGQKFLPETMGPGVALLDYNNDGKLDILFVNGRDWHPQGRKTLCALYRNNGNGTFTDVTAGSGL